MENPPRGYSGFAKKNMLLEKVAKGLKNLTYSPNNTYSDDDKHKNTEKIADHFAPQPNDDPENADREI